MQQFHILMALQPIGGPLVKAFPSASVAGGPDAAGGELNGRQGPEVGSGEGLVHDAGRDEVQDAAAADHERSARRQAAKGGDGGDGGRVHPGDPQGCLRGHSMNVVDAHPNEI